MVRTFNVMLMVAAAALLLAALSGCTQKYNKDDPVSVHYYCVLTQVWYDSGYRYGLSDSSLSGIACPRPYTNQYQEN